MSVSFDTVMLEVTRKCNMNCAHCMRGEMRDFDMQLYALKELFSQTKMELGKKYEMEKNYVRILFILSSLVLSNLID
mgnify:CR=1 FL=1